MTALPGPLRTLGRAPLPRVDARLVAGAALFVAVFMSNLLLWRAGRVTEPVVIAAREIAAGEVIALDDLALAPARLEGATAALALPASALGELAGLVAREPLRAGELVVRAALGALPEIGPDEVAVTVPVAADAVSPRLHRGAVVAVFGTAERQTPQSHTVAIVERAVVYDVGVQAEGLAFGPSAPVPAGRLTNVTLVVPRAAAPELAHALANWQLTLVLLSSSSPGGAR